MRCGLPLPEQRQPSGNAGLDFMQGLLERSGRLLMEQCNTTCRFAGSWT
jgi:hypothetical protein